VVLPLVKKAIGIYLLEHFRADIWGVWLMVRIILKMIKSKFFFGGRE